MLKLILQENSVHFDGRDYLQTHGTAMGTKMAVSFANIFMSAVETGIINKSKQNHSGGSDASMMYSLCGTLNERR